MKRIQSAAEKFCKDSDGKWVIAQFPNLLLGAWLLLLVVNLFLHDSQIKVLQSTVLFCWAYLELTQGDSYFRQTLGAMVLIGVIIGIVMGA